MSSLASTTASSGKGRTLARPRSALIKGPAHGLFPCVTFSPGFHSRLFLSRPKGASAERVRIGLGYTSNGSSRSRRGQRESLQPRVLHPFPCLLSPGPTPCQRFPLTAPGPGACGPRCPAGLFTGRGRGARHTPCDGCGVPPRVLALNAGARPTRSVTLI